MSTIAISTPVAHQGYEAPVTISLAGTYTGAAPTHVEASFNGGAFATIGSEIIGGLNWSGTITVGAGQGLTVRYSNDHTVTAPLASLAVGDAVALAIGDSRMAGAETNLQTYSGAGLISNCYERPTLVWSDNTDAATGSSAGTILPLLATQLLQGRGVPWNVLQAGGTGSDVVTSAGPGGWYPGSGALYTATQSAFTSSGLNRITYAIALLAPNCVVSAGVAMATIKSALAALAAGLASDYPGAPKVFVNIDGACAGTRADIDAYRQAVLSSAADGTIYVGPNMIDLNYDTHFTTDALATEVANRFWAAIDHYVFGAAHPGRGPRPTAAALDNSRKNITVTFDQDLGQSVSTSLDVAPWIVYDAGSPVSLAGASVTVQSARSVRVSVSAAIVGACTLTFGSGIDPKNTIVPVGAAIALPAGGTVSLPAEPFWSLSAPVGALVDVGLAFASQPTNASFARVVRC
jgi:hypothetical protein